jgi:hypothetical protein
LRPAFCISTGDEATGLLGLDLLGRGSAVFEDVFGGFLGLFGVGLFGQHVLATGLALGLVLAAGDVDGDVHLDLGMQGHGDGEQADRLDRGGDVHLLAVDGETAIGDRGGDVARRDRAVKLAAVACLADQDKGLAVQLVRDLLGLALELEVMGLELGLLSLEIFAVGLGGAQGLPLWQQEVAGEAVLHLHLVAHLAELLDPFEQNDLHGSGSLTSRHRAAAP